MHVCMYAWVYLGVYVFVYVYVYVYEWLYMYLYICVCVFVCVRVCGWILIIYHPGNSWKFGYLGIIPLGLHHLGRGVRGVPALGASPGITTGLKGPGIGHWGTEETCFVLGIWLFFWPKIAMILSWDGYEAPITNQESEY